MTLAVLVVVGLIAGALAASLGVGGGIIFVPALVIIAGFEQQLAQGTSLAVIVPTMVVAAWSHHRHDNVDWRAALNIGVLGVVGGLGGAWLALRLDEEALRRLFAVFLLLTAIRMLGRSLRRPESSTHR